MPRATAAAAVAAVAAAAAVVAGTAGGAHAAAGRGGGAAGRGGGAAVSDKWMYLGPWVMGKTEGDGDPAALYGGIQVLYDAWKGSGGRNSSAGLLSELVLGGTLLGWQRLPAAPPLAGLPAVAVSPPQPVAWQSLVSAVGMEVLEYQGWAVSSLRVPAPGGGVAVRCVGVPSFRLRAGGEWHLGAGDMYGTGRVRAVFTLPPGKHDLFVHVRAKVHASFACHAASVPPQDGAPQVQGVVVAPDAWGGRPAGDVMAVSVANPSTAAWYTVRCGAAAPGSRIATVADSGADGGGDGGVTLAPAGSLHLPCAIVPDGIQCDAAGRAAVAVTVSWCPLSRDAAAAVTMASVTAEGPAAATHDGCGATTVAHALECRTVSQSAVFTFVDHDGSVQPAAFIAPLPLPPAAEVDAAAAAEAAEEAATWGVPVLLSFHGTGVSPRGQVDAYKWKPAASDADYTFGVAGYWVVAPGRHGAHNWQGAGQWHGLQAPAALAAWVQRAAHGQRAPPRCTTWRDSVACVPAVDASRVLYAGHSMGGAGAWHAAAAAPDAAIALAPAAGWLAKETYGDANTAFGVEAHEADADAALRAVLLAAVSDQRSDSHAANVVGLPAHVRVGAADATTHPWYSRRMARLVADAAARARRPQYAHDGGVTVEEVAGKEHWWWDTAAANDGGVVNDATMRAFYAAVRDRLSAAAAWRWLVAGGVWATRLRQRRVGLAPTFDAVASAAGTYASGRGGLRIVAQRVPQRASRLAVAMVTLDVGWWSPRVWRITTTNAAAVTWDAPDGAYALLAATRPRAHLAAAAVAAWCNGTRTPDPPRVSTPSDAIVLPLFFCIDGVAAAVTDVIDGGGLCRGNHASHTWVQCTPQRATVASPKLPPDALPHAPPPPPAPALASPARRVSAVPFAIVVGGRGSRGAQWLRLAHFLSATHAAAYDTLAPVVPDWQWLAAPTRGAIVLGAAHENDAAASLLPPPPTIAGCATPAAGGAAGAAAIYVTTTADHRAAVLHLLAADDDAFTVLAQLATPTIPPMYRPPFVNLFPDFVFADSDTVKLGLAGIKAAGYWEQAPARATNASLALRAADGAYAAC